MDRRQPPLITVARTEKPRIFRRQSSGEKSGQIKENLEQQQKLFLESWKALQAKEYVMFLDVPDGPKRSIRFSFLRERISGKLKYDSSNGALDAELKIKFENNKEIPLPAGNGKGQIFKMKDKDRKQFLNDLVELYYIERVLNYRDVFSEESEITKNIKLGKIEKPKMPKPPGKGNRMFLVEYRNKDKIQIAVKTVAKDNKEALAFTQWRYGAKDGPASVTPWSFSDDEGEGDAEIFD